MGILEALAEDLAAADAGAALSASGVPQLGGKDDRYWRSMSYAFQLHAPTASSLGFVEHDAPSLFFPLVLNPTSYQKSHPFSAELTPTQEGGVIAEENGVIISQITISGHTGVSRRPNAGSGLPIPLSGQAHFLYLQNACFLRYSELKKDPKIAAQVYLTFHNFKDGEHYVVVPKEFRLERAADNKNFFYNYTIQLAVVGNVENPPQDRSEDSEVMKALANVSRNIKVAAAGITAFQTDTSGFQAQVDAVIGGALANANAALTSIGGAVSEFTRGIRGYINLPLAAVRAATDTLATAARLINDNSNFLGPSYLELHALVRTAEDMTHTLLSYPEKFREDFAENANRFLRLIAGPSDRNADELTLAAASTLTQPEQLQSSGPRPGDQERVDSGFFDVKRVFPRYTGFREVTIRFGDTIASIASKELGDARRWIDVALANGIKAPYISEEGLPGTLRPGETILIPTTAATQPIQQVRSAGDPVLGESQLEALFGKDLLIRAQSDGTYDLAVDPTDFEDILAVGGLPNLEQAVVSILSTEQGSNLLYRNVGYSRIVGQKGTVERVVEGRSKIVEAVQRDPRVSRVKNASMSLDQDVLEVSLEVIATDATSQRVIGRVIS